MALPINIQVPLDDLRHKVANAANVSRKPVRCFRRTTYRDTIDASFLGNAHKQMGTTGTVVILPWSEINGHVISSITRSAAVQESEAFDDALFQQSDEYTHVWPRQKEEFRTLVQFWSGAIGHAMTLTADVTAGSATIVVPDNELLTPGQLITGTGIPSGARILSVLVPEAPSTTNHNFARTKVILTHKCTGSGTSAIEATLTGSDLLGEIWDDEHHGWSADVGLVE